MIDRLVARRFRGIREGVLEDCAKLNVLVGPNNSGKTAVLEMLYLTAVSGREGGLVLEDGSRFEARVPLRHDFLGYRPLPRLWARHGQSPGWEKSPGGLTEAQGLWYQLRALPKVHPLHQFRIAPPSGKAGYEVEDFDREDVQSVALFALEQPHELPAEMMPDWLSARVQTEASRLTYLWYPDFVFRGQADQQAPLDHLAIWALEGVDQQASIQIDPARVMFFDFHVTHAHFYRRFWDFAYKAVPDWYERLAQAMGRIFPDMASGRVEINPAPNDQKVAQMVGDVRLPGRHPIRIDNFGDGARHAFKVLAGLIALAETVDEERPGLFVWEDPELFMHPTTLGRLLGEVVDLVQRRPIQVFISTQNLETIAHVTHQASQQETLTENLRAFRLGLREGRLISATFKYHNLISWLQDGMDPRFWGVSDTLLSYRMGGSQ
jgi:hypothetical protein